jgi:hypothetical protein
MTIFTKKRSLFQQVMRTALGLFCSTYTHDQLMGKGRQKRILQENAQRLAFHSYQTHQLFDSAGAREKKH